MTTPSSSERLSRQADDTVPNIRWDDSNMRSSYFNVCNVAGTREEIILLLGVNQAWHRDVKEVTVQLQERVILNPYAAKRLSTLLNRVIHEYEQRYGTLQLDGVTPTESATGLPTR
jgi:hypothetical protein